MLFRKLIGGGGCGGGPDDTLRSQMLGATGAIELFLLGDTLGGRRTDRGNANADGSGAEVAAGVAEQQRQQQQQQQQQLLLIGGVQGGVRVGAQARFAADIATIVVASFDLPFEGRRFALDHLARAVSSVGGDAKDDMEDGGGMRGGVSAAATAAKSRCQESDIRFQQQH